MLPSPDSCESWFCDSSERKSALSIGLGKQAAEKVIYFVIPSEAKNLSSI
jgi:hypothetical protein